MVIIGAVADDEAAGAGRPVPTANAGSFARQPASLHYGNNNYTRTASDIADTAPSSSSLLPPLPPSTVSSYWSSSPLQQQQYHYQWPQQHAAPASSSSFLADDDLHASISNDEFFAAMMDHLSRPQSASDPFAQLGVPPQEQQQQAQMQQMQFATQAYPIIHNQAMASPVVEAVPLAVVPAGVAATGGPALAGSTGDEEAANKPAPRRRGRPRKNPAAVGSSSPAKQPAPRWKASAASTSSSSSSASRKARQTAAQQAASIRAAPPRTNGPADALLPAAYQEEQLQLQVTTSSSSNPCAWELEALMVEERTEPYENTTVPGVRFQPTNEEIIGYLRLKYLGRKMPVDFIKDSNVYQAHPETVTASCGESVNGCWYVFSPRRRRYPNGGRPARSVDDELGFWKSNTKEADIRVDGNEGGAVIGKVTALTFELGHQPDGIQTPWKMKEYCIPEKQHQPDGSNMLLDDWVLCKIFCNAHDDKDTQVMIPADEGDQLDDVDEAGGGEEMQITNVGQGGQPDAAAGEAEHDANMQIVSADQTPSEEDLCVEDYLVSDPTFTDQNDAAN